MKAPAQIAILAAALLLAAPKFPSILANPAFAAQKDADSKAGSGPAQIPAALPKGKKLILKDGTYQ
jgi:hypothetical protein